MGPGAVQVAVAGHVRCTRGMDIAPGQCRAITEAIRKALEDAGIEFIPENGGGLGVRFAKRCKSSKT